ncbi:EamA-like transporter family protein [Enhydrobacter aerosaccus]|uniref:EamA-like transporter family protein n=1 Tax=Enhydrobacter aerosaccus TaxID=225324 RepID=A0A1T4RYD1_9HYPH|nr:EamA family transporter [Enhydrobacter aerosaccus]SKA20728.1 EamA-like transporter family protein [Enhydrobacter aerosaccus]
MQLWDVVGALVSAALHAGWNAAIKAHPKPTEAMTAQMMVCALLVLPGLFWTGLPSPSSWPWLAASTCINLVTVTALLRAYALVGFGLVYPVVRALSVLLVVALATLLSGETLSLYGFLGIGLIALSLFLLAQANASTTAVPRRALLWILLAGLSTAAYVLCDAQGVRHAGSPWAYGFVVSITNAVAMSLAQSRIARPWRILADHAIGVLPISIAAILSYQLILWVWSHAPVAPASALRDTSSAFALLIAVIWLHEPFTRLRLLAVLLSAAAVPLMRLA